MGDKSIWTALCAAVILAASGSTASAQAVPPTEQLFCDPNPWVTGGFCDQINAFNRYYCEWPCGIPPIEQPYLGSNTPPPVPDDDDLDDTRGDTFDDTIDDTGCGDADDTTCGPP